MPTVIESLNRALHKAMASDERVYVIGEDILDPYGGAFKVTQGLSTTFPHRTLTTPVSEAGMIGIATGMALRGILPVVEIMFGDFLTLAADQVINHMTKFRYMYNDQVSVPLVLRTPMGGRRGYGPTHSQTLEKLFMGSPGLRILAPSILIDPGELLLLAIFEDDDPVLFIENKVMYTQSVLSDDELNEFNITVGGQDINSTREERKTNIELLSHDYAPTLHLTLRDAPAPSITIAAYGYMADLCRLAALALAYEHEIFADLVVLTQLSPIRIKPILDSVILTKRLLVVEEGTQTLGWGAEIIARTAESLGSELISAARVAAKDLPIPASGPLEKMVLPDVDDIIRSIKKMV